MSEPLSLDRQYDLAGKIETLIMFVGLLADDEVEAIKSLKEKLEDEIPSLQAVAGVLAPLEETEHKIAHYRAMIKRTDAIIAISESNKEMSVADGDLEKSKESRDMIAKMFGL
jgi:hypothetical protein